VRPGREKERAAEPVSIVFNEIPLLLFPGKLTAIANLEKCISAFYLNQSKISTV